MLVPSLFSTNKNRKFVKTMIYICRVVYTAQTKARQALGKSSEFVKTTISIHRVVYTMQMRARTNNYSEKILITWTTHLKNKQGEDIQARKT